MNLDERNELYTEAKYLYLGFFNECPPEWLLEKYVRVHDAYDVSASQKEIKAIGAIVKHGLDVEAVEYVMRLRKRDNLLTKKVEIIHYLAECSSRRFGDFFLEADIDWRGWVLLLRSLVRVPWCFVMGHWLIRRHGLA